MYAVCSVACVFLSFSLSLSFYTCVYIYIYIHTCMCRYLGCPGNVQVCFTVPPIRHGWCCGSTDTIQQPPERHM